jgi:hypothetical protein
MRTSGILLVSIAGFGFALWLARGGEPPKTSVIQSAAASAPAEAGAPDRPRALPATRGGVTAQAATPKLDPRSEAFRSKLDDQIPTHLYAEASRCYKGGGQRDERLDVTYHIRVENGAVTIGNVRVSETTLADTQLERCILDTLSHAAWRDDQLPDLQEDDDLFMRVAGFSAYLANADDDSVGGSAMN